MPDIFRLRLRSLFARTVVEQELDEELQYHLERQIEESIAAGMSRDEARLLALRCTHGLEQRKEECRDMRGLNLIDNLLQDGRTAIRQLRKNPGFTCTAILMLAAGICASVAIFAFVDAALLKPLPYRNPARLVGVYESKAICKQCNLSYPDYLDWKKLNTVFSSLDVYQHNGLVLSTPSGAERAQGARVSAGFFRTLGIAPLLGRDFHSGEDSLAAPGTALLSYAAWQKRYGGKDVLGQTVTLNDIPTTIVGVLPQDFHYAPAEPVEFWIPLQPSNRCYQSRGCHSIYGVARLKDGASVETALAETTLIARQLEKQYPDSNRDQGASVVPLAEVIAGNIRPLLLVLLSGAGMLLLIACVNIAGLLLVRSEGRKREMAVRSALGASRARLAGQFATEGLVLVTAGGGIGLLSAYWTMQLLGRLIPTGMMASRPFLNGLHLNFRVLAFAGAVSLAAAVLFSIMPTLGLSRSGIGERMAEGSRGSSGNAWRRLGSKLVVLELAIAMVLLAGAGLLGKSFYRLLHVELGFEPDHLAKLEVAAPQSGYSKDEQLVALQRQLVSRVASLPGVTSASISTMLPVSFNGNTDWIRFVGKPYNGEHNEVNQRDVSSGYFTTLRARLLRGRYFSDAEDASKPRVAIINQTLARQYFAGDDPIGRKFGDTNLSPASIKEIIGIVDDIREGSLESEIWPAVYYPFNQSTDAYFSVIVRTLQDERSLLPTLTAAVHQVDPGIATASPATMSERISDSTSAYVHRSAAWLMGGFAAMALLLGVVGLYGVIAYSVSQRTREIGVRMALGAEPGAVYQLILKEAGWLAAIGIVVGLMGSVAAATLMGKLLFGTPPWDIPTLTAVAAVLAVASLLASYIPARRAASVNPIDALRAE